MRGYIRACAFVILASFIMAAAGCSLLPQPDVDVDYGEGGMGTIPGFDIGGSGSGVTETGSVSDDPSFQTEVVTVDNSFRFTPDNMPVIDGSSATLSLGIAAESVLLGRSPDSVASDIKFHTNGGAYNRLIEGTADLLLVTAPSDSIMNRLQEADITCEYVPFAKEALVFYVNPDNPVDSLTIEQIRGIYEGTITNWSEVGGEDVEISVFGRNEDSGAGVFFDRLIPSYDTDEASDDPDTSLDRGQTDITVSYDNSPGAIGFSLYHYMTDMNEFSDGLKILSVEDVSPSAETIGDGSYPLVEYYYVVIRADAPDNSPVRVLRDWMLTSDGQSLVWMENYIPVNDEWSETNG